MEGGIGGSTLERVMGGIRRALAGAQALGVGLGRVRGEGRRREGRRRGRSVGSRVRGDGAVVSVVSVVSEVCSGRGGDGWC